MGRRHWKQRWNPDAEFVFLKRLKLGIEGHEFVQPGDPVPKAHPLIRNRLRRWWAAEIIGLADFEVKKTGSNRPVRPDELAAFRVRALEELRSIEPSTQAALGMYHKGSLYGILVGNGVYGAKMPLVLPDDVEVPWERVQNKSVPVVVLGSFDFSFEKTPVDDGPVLKRGNEFLVISDDPDGVKHEASFGTMEAALAFIGGEDPLAEVPTVKSLGGGWYEVTVVGEGEGTIQRVRGKVALDVMLKELGVGVG